MAKDYRDVKESYQCGACGETAERVIRKYDSGANAIEREIPHSNGQRQLCSGRIKVEPLIRDTPAASPTRSEPERPSWDYDF